MRPGQRVSGQDLFPCESIILARSIVAKRWLGLAQYFLCHLPSFATARGDASLIRHRCFKALRILSLEGFWRKHLKAILLQ